MRLPSHEIVTNIDTSSINLRSLLTGMMDSSSENGNYGYNNPINTGMTSAISTASPKPIDIKLTHDLKEALKPYGCFETVEEMTHRMEVLSRLDRLVKDWVRDVSISKNIPPSVAEQVRPKVYLDDTT